MFDEEIKKVIEEMGIDWFVETSAKKNVNVEELFVKAAKILVKEALMSNDDQKRVVS